MQYVEEIITLEEETIIEREDGSLIAFYDNKRVRAKLNDLQATAGVTTYVWEAPDENYCPLYLVKTFVGNIITTNSTNDQVIASTDGQAIRLIKRTTEIECNRHVYSTNYPQIFLYPANDISGTARRDLFTEKLPKGEAQLSVYITNRDDTLYHKLHSEIKREYQAVWADECYRRYKDVKLEHFLAREFPGFYTYSLGGNNFLTTAGECTYKYTCAVKLVKAINLDHCYDALPVIAYDMKNWEKARRTPQFEKTEQRWYIEPLTHRLTRVATRVPCTKRFYARYRDVLDRWFAVTPTLRAVDDPEDIIVKPSDRFNHDYKDSNFGPGKGIYDSDQIDGIQDHLEFGRVKEALTQKLADQVWGLTADGSISPSQLFPNRVLHGGSWQSFILGRFMGWVHSFGEIASTLLGIYILTRLFWALFKMLANLYQLYSINGCSATLFMVFCIEIFHSHRLFRDYKGRKDNSPRGNKPGPQPWHQRIRFWRKNPTIQYSSESGEEGEKTQMLKPNNLHPTAPSERCGQKGGPLKPTEGLYLQQAVDYRLPDEEGVIAVQPIYTAPNYTPAAAQLPAMKGAAPPQM